MSYDNTGQGYYYINREHLLAERKKKYNDYQNNYQKLQRLKNPVKPRTKGNPKQCSKCHRIFDTKGDVQDHKYRDHGY